MSSHTVGWVLIVSICELRDFQEFAIMYLTIVWFRLHRRARASDVTLSRDQCAMCVSLFLRINYVGLSRYFQLISNLPTSSSNNTLQDNDPTVLLGFAITREINLYCRILFIAHLTKYSDWGVWLACTRQAHLLDLQCSFKSHVHNY
jgi:hypothetical protein